MGGGEVGHEFLCRDFVEVGFEGFEILPQAFNVV